MTQMLIGNIFILMTTVPNDQDQYINTFVGLLKRLGFTIVTLSV